MEYYTRQSSKGEECLVDNMHKVDGLVACTKIDPIAKEEQFGLLEKLRSGYELLADRKILGRIVKGCFLDKPFLRFLMQVVLLSGKFLVGPFLVLLS